jgi:hypothetical protein
VLWFGFGVLMLSLIPGKRSAYLMPTVPWAALIFSPMALHLLIDPGRASRWGRLLLQGLVLLLAAAAIGFLLVSAVWLPSLTYAASALLMLAAVGLGALRWMRRQGLGDVPSNQERAGLRPVDATILLIVSIATGWIFAGVVQPMREGTAQSRRFLAEVERHVPATQAVGVMRVSHEGLIFYAHRRVERLPRTVLAVQAFLDRPGRQILLVRDAWFRRMRTHLPEVSILARCTRFEGSSSVVLMQETPRPHGP